MTTVTLGLGSNKGDRLHHLITSLALLLKHPDIFYVDISPIYESKSDGFDSSDFYNLVLVVETNLDIRTFFNFSTSVEKTMGKEKRRNRNEAYSDRTIDIDMIYFGNTTANYDDLIVPHPEIHNRVFVSKPLYKLKKTLTSRGIIAMETFQEFKSKNDIQESETSTSKLYQWIEKEITSQNR